MTYRDPLYDSNSPATEGSLEDQFDDATGKATNPEGSDAAERGKQAADMAREKGQEVAGQVKEKGAEAIDTAKVKADELGQMAHEKADVGLDKASEGLSVAAEKLREQGGKQPGQVGNVASTAADKLDSASGYLREHNSDQMVSDLEELVRRRPMESLVVAAGIGLLLSRIVK